MCLCVVVLLKPVKGRLRFVFFIIVYSTGYVVEKIISSSVSFSV